MKFKTTRKEIMSNYSKVYEVSYGALQNMLKFMSPVAYTSGTYGWNADIYDLGSGIAICTGYRPFGNRKLAYDFVRRYDKKAEEIHEPDKMHELVCDFLDALLSNYPN